MSDKNIWKQPSILGGVALMIVACVVFWVELEPQIEDEYKHISLTILGLFATLFISLLFYVLDIFHAFQILRSEQNNSLTILKRQIECFTNMKSDDWLHHFVPDLAINLIKAKEINQHLYSAMKQRLDNEIIKLKRSMIDHDKPIISYYPKANESERMAKLKTTVKDAENYVMAVTLDSGTYLQDFWSGKFAEEFLDQNALKRLNVSRIFLLDRNIINEQDKPKHSIMTKILQFHQKHNIPVKVVCKDNYPPKCEKLYTSFLVCDDVIVSESYSLHDDGKTDGYVAYNDRNGCSRLKTIFLNLETQNDENWIKR